MIVPLTVRDFLNRAEHVYGARIGIVDEPAQPASVSAVRAATAARSRPAARPMIGARIRSLPFPTIR